MNVTTTTNKKVLDRNYPLMKDIHTLSMAAKSRKEPHNTAAQIVIGSGDDVNIVTPEKKEWKATSIPILSSAPSFDEDDDEIDDNDTFDETICIPNHQFLAMGGRRLVENKLKVFSSCEYHDTDRSVEYNELPIDMPVHRSYFGVVRVENRLYLMGGISSDTDGSYRDLYSIDISCDSNDENEKKDWKELSGRDWEILAPMKTRRGDFGCVHDPQTPYIYVFGGMDGPYTLLNTCERYHIDTNTWESLPPMPDRRCSSAAGIVGNKIYIVGGCDENAQTLASTLVFDIAKQQWLSPSCVPLMSTPRWSLSVIVVGQYLLAIGGGNKKEDCLGDIEILDTRSSHWRKDRRRHSRPSQISVGGGLHSRVLHTRDLYWAFLARVENKPETTSNYLDQFTRSNSFVTDATDSSSIQNRCYEP